MAQGPRNYQSNRLIALAHRRDVCRCASCTASRAKAQRTTATALATVTATAAALDACLRHALETRGPHGIWGGMTSAERRELLAKHGIWLPKHHRRQAVEAARQAVRAAGASAAQTPARPPCRLRSRPRRWRTPRPSIRCPVPVQ